MEKEKDGKDDLGAENVSKKTSPKASLFYLVAGAIFLGLGYLAQRYCLFLYTGWAIEPSYLGRILAALGSICLALGVKTLLGLRKFGFLLIAVAVIGIDIYVDGRLKTEKAATIEREIMATSPTALATIEKLNTAVNRMSNAMKRPYIVCAWEASGKKYRQIFWVSAETSLRVGGSITVRYADKDPRIAVLVE